MNNIFGFGGAMLLPQLFGLELYLGFFGGHTVLSRV
jgi:hypothetical protein